MRPVRRPHRRLAHEGLAECHHHGPLLRRVAKLLHSACDAADRAVIQNVLGTGTLGRLGTKRAVPPRLVVTVDDVDRRRCAASIVTGGRLRCGRRCRVAVGSLLLRGVAAAIHTSGGRRACRQLHLLVGGLLLD